MVIKDVNEKKYLEDLIKKKIGNKKIIIVANKEPYEHIKIPNGIFVNKPSGGVSILMDNIAKLIGKNALYIASSSGNADKEFVDKRNIVKVPPDEKIYNLKRVFLTKKEIEGFYYGFSNQTMWPLCHAVFVKPEFNENWWREYQKVNIKFAKNIFEEIKKDDEDNLIWINDYHFCLLPKILKDNKKNLKIGFFWHIPWPTYEIFRINPWAKEILESLLKSDFLYFHRGYHVQNFMQNVKRILNAEIDEENSEIKFNHHNTKIRSLPAGIDYNEIIKIKKNCKLSKKEFLKKEVNFYAKFIILGVERLDYIKGIVEKLKIIDKFLEKYPEFIGKIVYFGIHPYSRLNIPYYRDYLKKVLDLIQKINWKYQKNNWKPIVITFDSYSREKIINYYRIADVCIITSLDDGMNLVAKEFVLSCNVNKGMLILSKFAGASYDLKFTLLINPYNIEESAESLKTALIMKSKEKRERNLNMIKEITNNNIIKWFIKFIENY